MSECYVSSGKPVCGVDGSLRSIETGENVMEPYLSVDEEKGTIRSYNGRNQILAEVNLKGEKIVARERAGGGGGEREEKGKVGKAKEKGIL